MLSHRRFFVHPIHGLLTDVTECGERKSNEVCNLYVSQQLSQQAEYEPEQKMLKTWPKT